MKFRAIFIGIDRYASSLVSNLSCSVRDAQALYGLFCDSLGADDAVLLTNEQATRLCLIQAIEELQDAAADDVVVISFSGHGSDSHHLLSYDADPSNFDKTAIQLDELTALFSKIPAKNVVLLLDCCFAGGAGAKVFHAPIAMRSSESAAALLDSISGRGRIIFSAAAADQEAIEDRRRGHGLFTFYLLQALRGAPEILQVDRIPILGLIQFVTASVVAAAAQFRHSQEPALRGTVDGEFTFPVLTPGIIFRTFFPDTTSAFVTDQIKSLAGFGFPPGILDVLQSAIPTLNELQQEAINKMGLFQDQHLVVSAPTSSGKTMIGELAAVNHYLLGERSYFLLPLRALVNDKFEEFTSKYGEFGLRIIRSTGEISDDNDALMRGKFDIAFITYERFAALAVGLPYILRQVGLIVVDEVQMITDLNRGANLEFVLTLLKAQRLLGVEPQLIALSAVIGNTNGFETWLSARLLSSSKRPIPLDEGILDMSGSFRYVSAATGKEQIEQQYVTPEPRKGSSQDVIIPLVRQLAKSGEKLIVFRETKPIVRATAEYLKLNLGFGAATETLQMLPTGDPSAASAQLRACLEHGVAFHNADLDREERHAIEATFRDPNSSLRVLVATTTLAMGVNTPAWSVIIAGLEHPGDSPYSVAEYKNMVGRAGRLGYTPKGKSFLIAPSSGDAYKLWTRYVLGSPESLQSRFADQDPLSLICRVLATANAAKTDGLTHQDLIDFIESTFAAHQHGSVLNAAAISENLLRLTSAGLVDQADSRYRLTELGKVAGELGVRVESVVRIGRALRGLAAAQTTDSVIVATAQISLELDDIIFPVHKKSIQERHRWQGAASGYGLPPSVIRELQATDDGAYTARCKRLAAVLMWLEGIDLNGIESSLLRHLPGDNAAGPIRSTAERTRDLIGVVSKIATLVSSDHNSPPVDIDDLSTRLEIGVPADMLWLAKRLRRILERGDYLSMRRAGLITFDSLQKCDDETLSKIISSPQKRTKIREAVESAISEDPQNPDDNGLPMPSVAP